MTWYGKIMFRDEGILTYSENLTKQEAEAFVNGFKIAKEISEEDEIDILEDYWTVVDQLEPLEVS